MRLHTKHTKAFTILEILCVVIIIIILSTLFCTGLNRIKRLVDHTKTANAAHNARIDLFLIEPTDHPIFSIPANATTLEIVKEQSLLGCDNF